MVSLGPTRSGPVPADWRRLWVRYTIVSAVGITIADAFLLQQKKAFFTGGFLSAYHTSGLLEAATFLGVSLLCDAGVAAVLAAAAIAVTGLFRLTPLARHAGVLLLTAAPLLIADVVIYQLLTYLGDAFDLSLMFDLTGRQPGEFLAVSSQHLIAPSLLVIGGCLAAAGVVWAVNRTGHRQAAARLRVPRRAIALAAACLLGGATVFATARAASETFEDGLRRKPAGSLFGAIADLVTDVDRDGFGVGGRLSDPAPFDRAIYPYALEIPGDGIDQNGVAGDLPAGTEPYVEPPPTLGWVRRPDVVLIVLESFRADAVGRTVNGRPVTPVLDRLAREGIAVPLAFSHNGYTAESRHHLFSGSLTGVRPGGTLIDDFKSQGYEVAYFSGQDDSFGGSADAVGMARADVAYDARQDRNLRYTTFTTPGSLAVPHDVVQRRLADFLARRDPGRPLFLYVNFHDTHYPYWHGGMQPLVSDVVVPEARIHPSRARALREMYDNAAANVDAAIGATLALLEERLSAPPAVIVTADHGESLFDAGFLGHGYALNDVQTRIPLIVSGLDVEIEQPFGQSELRDLLGSTLSREDRGVRPAVRTRPGKEVFQYLGTLQRPRQLGLVSAEGRVIYDFRTNRVRFGDDGLRPPADLAAGDEVRFVELVRWWERMILARSTRDDP